MKKLSLLKRNSSGSVRALPRLMPAEQHIQMSIRKRATAFVDARDELERKFGRLSRRVRSMACVQNRTDPGSRTSPITQVYSVRASTATALTSSVVHAPT